MTIAVAKWIPNATAFLPLWRSTTLQFASPDTPAHLRSGFDELLQAVRPLTGDDPEILTETFWASLHGLVMLERSGRLPADAHQLRLNLLIDRFAPAAT